MILARRLDVQPSHLEAEKSHSWDPNEGLGLHIISKDLSCDASTQEDHKSEARMGYIGRPCQKEEKMKKKREGRKREEEEGDGKGWGRVKGEGEGRLDGGLPTEVNP